jgi:hypothetical protein
MEIISDLRIQNRECQRHQRTRFQQGFAPLQDTKKE